MKGITKFLEDHRLHFFDILRIYLGFFLVLKGLEFTGKMDLLFEMVGATSGDFLNLGMAHYVLVANIVGGVFLTAGLLTRWAAAFNLPNLLGALFILSRTQDFWSSGSDLPITLMASFTLFVFALTGGGPLSVDHWMAEYFEKHEGGRIWKTIAHH